MGNFRVEPPGLFRGRGEHPKMGQLKARIFAARAPRNSACPGAQFCAILLPQRSDPSLPPQDITINIGKRAKVPPVPDIGDGKKHNWGDVVHVDTVTWLAKWKDSINGEDK